MGIGIELVFHDSLSMAANGSSVNTANTAALGRNMFKDSSGAALPNDHLVAVSTRNMSSPATDHAGTLMMIS